MNRSDIFFFRLMLSISSNKDQEQKNLSAFSMKNGIKVSGIEMSKSSGINEYLNV